MWSAAAADPDRVRDAVDPIDEDDGVGGFGGDGCARGAHCDADIGESKGWGVVDAVADHDDGPQLGSLV